MASALRVQVSPSAFFNFKLNNIFRPISENPDLVVVIISNGPGELTTWVKPIAEKLKEELKSQRLNNNSNICLRLTLVPCPNATGNEYELAKKWKLFEKITPAKSFWNLLLNPRKFGLWPEKGLVVFLGGDQFWSVLLSARLKYLHLTYAEWVVRWPFWNDRIAAMSPEVKNLLPKKLRNRCSVVGDLMADLNPKVNENHLTQEGTWIALLPGSKKAKLIVGIPFFLEIADHMSSANPSLNFIIPIAPTTNIKEIKEYGNQRNPISKKYLSGIKEIKTPLNTNESKILITKNDTHIHLIEEHPAHDYLIQCNLALTTIGANTAELGALAVPMIVIVPTQHLEVMEAWDGLLGIIGRLPIFKWCIGFLISLWRMRKKGFLAWPNITAKRMIVPERVGEIFPKEIATEALDWLNHKEKLKKQKEDLQLLRGKPGAVKKLANEILDLIS